MLDAQSCNGRVAKIETQLASLDGDSLHQWTEYAGLDGFAIGFKVERGNVNLLENQPFNSTPEKPRDQSQYVSSWRNVLYDPAAHARTSSAFIDLLARTLDPVAFGADPDDGITNDYTAELFAPPAYAAIVTRLKTTKSAAENETRITATTLDAARFHGKTPTGRPKVDLTGWTRPASITGTSSFTSPAPTPLPIVEIRTGPNAETADLRVLLNRAGYGHVRISASRHPTTDDAGGPQGDGPGLPDNSRGHDRRPLPPHFESGVSGMRQ